MTEPFLTSPPPRATAPDELERVRTEIDRLRASIEQTDREIDDLQVRTAEGHRPWHRNAQTLVAVFSLLLTFAVGLTSVYWAKVQADLMQTQADFTQAQSDATEARLQQQQLHDAKTELRGLLQALTELTRTSPNLQEVTDPYLAQYLATNELAEMSLLTNQAYDVAQSIPEHVSSTELLTISQRLGQLGDFQKAETMLIRANETAETAYEVLSATRTYGIHLFGKGDIAAGRDHMQRALAVWTSFPEVKQLDPVTVQVEDLVTRMRWAEAESILRYCAEAEPQVAAADALMLELGETAAPVVRQQYDLMVMTYRYNCDPTFVAPLPDPATDPLALPTPTPFPLFDPTLGGYTPSWLDPVGTYAPWYPPVATADPFALPTATFTP
jgi:hypothetical protein